MINVYKQLKPSIFMKLQVVLSTLPDPLTILLWNIINHFDGSYFSKTVNGTTRGPALDLGNVNSISTSFVLNISFEYAPSSDTVASILSLVSTLLSSTAKIIVYTFYSPASTVLLGRFLVPFLRITEGGFKCSSFQSSSSILDFRRWSFRVL